MSWEHVLILIVSFTIICLHVDELVFNLNHWVLRKHKNTPVRGYKVAYVDLRKKNFHGVSGGSEYKVDDTSSNRIGFHAFYNYDDALELQKSFEFSVILEVVLYGQIERRETGAVSTRQRVLQVILPECSVINCSKQSSHIIEAIRPNFSDRETLGNDFVCQRDLKFIKRWAASGLVSRRYSTPVSVKQLREIFENEDVVVSGSVGAYRFIPTEHSLFDF